MTDNVRRVYWVSLDDLGVFLLTLNLVGWIALVIVVWLWWWR